MTKKRRMPRRTGFDLLDQKVAFEVYRTAERAVWDVVFNPVEWKVERTVSRHVKEQLR